MFEGSFSKEDRRKLFELIYKLSICDGESTGEEQELIRDYAAKFSIEEIPDTDSLEGLAAYFASKDLHLRRMVLFEVCGLILADRKVGENEQRAFDYIKSELSLGNTVTEDIVSAANDFKIIKDKIYDIVYV